MLGKAQPIAEDWPPANRRKDLRKPLLVLRARLDDGRKAFFGYAKNISCSGMFIASVNPRQPGEQFEVELTLPAPLNLAVSCTCEVVWKRSFSRRSDLDPGMGLRFLDLPEDVAQAIDDWIAQDA
ncbi:PilZ domain-containing protein [Geoalkalibacter halelectricus]|uniref:PilZ domain-containing protein n=1 Tax=Geoalkalibacter halelectricus TaxID=2847045 RepID=UPI003D1D87D4